MLLAGIVSGDDNSRTANIINSIFTAAGRKVSILDSKILNELKQNQIKDYMKELEKNNVDILILKINFSDLNNSAFESLNFDIMVYNDKADYIKVANVNNDQAALEKAKTLLDEKGIVIVNIDDKELIRLLQGMKYYVVTYGFNSKASMTTSSVGDILDKDSFMCCLQRTISATNGQTIEPQEYKLRIEATGMDVYNVLAAAAFAVVNGIDLSGVEQLTLV
ncbi:MAG: glutamate ligase [Clostridia bacterium]|nr:glutamate ligase [Clostridia bacterium]